MTDELPHHATADVRAVPEATVVTGAAGWLGLRLTERLAQQPSRRLRCFVHDHSQADSVRAVAPRAHLVVGDIRDPESVSRLFDGLDGCTVLHTAAVIHPKRRVRELFDVNVGGTSLVLDHARRASASRVVHVSSNSPFGFNRSPNEMFDESAAYAPAGGYGESKMEAEQRVLQLVDRGLDAVIVRAPWFYGPGQPERQTAFFTAVRKGQFPLVGDGSNRRSMVYVDNLVDGLLRAERREGVAGQCFWIADEKRYEMREILASVKGALQRAGLDVSAKQRRVPGAVGEIASVADRILQGVGLYNSAVHVLSEMNKTIACSIELARKTLGYEPQIAIDDGMDRSIAWCLERGISL